MLQITKDIVDTLLKKGKCTLSHQLSENLMAVVKLTQKGDDISVTAHLRTLVPSEPVKEVPKATHICRSMDMVEIDARDTCNRLLRRWHALNSPMSKERSKSKSAENFEASIQAIPGIFDPQNYTPYVKRGWGQTTTTQAVTYFACTFGKFFENNDFNVTVQDYMVFLEQLIDEIYAKEYRHPTKDGAIIKQRRNAIADGLASRWYRARAVQQYVLEHHPEIGCPAMLIPLIPRYKTPKTEQIKAATPKQYITLVTLVIRLCRMEHSLAFCALGEVLGGERIGESCAHLLGDFEIVGDYARCYISYQIDDDGNRTDILKSEYSYRYNFYTGLMVAMINLRKTQLLNQGYDADKIPLMPFGADKNNPYNFIRKQRVSAFLRRLLLLAGCDEEWLAKEAEEMFVAAKAAGNSEDLDVSAHLLRRTVATFLANGGVPENYVDAVLGHANEKNKKVSYASKDKAVEIAAMMERAIYLGKLGPTRNPAYTPVPLRGNTDYVLQGNNAYCFHAEEDVYIDIDATALESEHGLRVIIPDHLRSGSFVWRQSVDTLESKKSRPVIAASLHDKDAVEQWICEAEQIDLSEFAI